MKFGYRLFLIVWSLIILSACFYGTSLISCNDNNIYTYFRVMIGISTFILSVILGSIICVKTCWENDWSVGFIIPVILAVLSLTQIILIILIAVSIDSCTPNINTTGYKNFIGGFGGFLSSIVLLISIYDIWKLWKLRNVIIEVKQEISPSDIREKIEILEVQIKEVERELPNAKKKTAKNLLKLRDKYKEKLLKWQTRLSILKEQQDDEQEEEYEELIQEQQQSRRSSRQEPQQEPQQDSLIKSDENVLQSECKSIKVNDLDKKGCDEDVVNERISIMAEINEDLCQEESKKLEIQRRRCTPSRSNSNEQIPPEEDFRFNKKRPSNLRKKRRTKLGRKGFKKRC